VTADQLVQMLRDRMSMIPFRVSPLVPLTRTCVETGKVSDALCWSIGGVLVFHPTRLAQFKQEFATRERELSRWADDGGPS
jgi:hypothetical protein